MNGEPEKDVQANTHSATKTDLALLLECVKFQMKCPDSQKQALLAVYSICHKREHNVDIFREMGGVAFVYSLSKSSIVHSDVKETALFTLGALAETNVYCKTSLCRKETFLDLASSLMRGDSTVTQRRVAVYLLSVLVANNKIGQTLAQTTGCLDVLLDLFRTSFPFSTEESRIPLNVSQVYQLWTSVSSALCGCVNNPQNEETQRICVVAFPLVITWLQVTLPRTEIFQPICSFIAMTVANNCCAQESFSVCGGLETLALTLVRFAAESEKSLLSCQISVIIAKTLSSCVTHNAVLATGLAQHGLVPQLLSLLSSPNLDPQDRLPVLLILGHCTEASEEHQLQLVQCGGLSTVITLLTEFPNEEHRKAATFILQTCKQATMSLGAPGPAASQGGEWDAEPLTAMSAFWRSARELLHRINKLKKGQAKEGDGPMTVNKDPRSPPVDSVHLLVNGQRTSGAGEVEEWRRLGEASELRLKGGDTMSHEAQIGERVETGANWQAGEGRNLLQFTSPLPTRQPFLREKRPMLQQSDQRCAGSVGPRPALQRRNNVGEEEMYRGEYVQHSDRTLHPLSRVRRQIFITRDQRQNSALDSRVKEERSLSKQSQQRRSTGSGSTDIKAAAACAKVGVPQQVFVGGNGMCSLGRRTGNPVTPSVSALECVREPRCDSQLFKPTAQMKRSVPREEEWMDDDCALSLCSELLDKEISRMRKPPLTAPASHGARCSGCTVRFGEVTSRTPSAFMSSHSCLVHKVLQDATDGFRARHHDMLSSTEHQRGRRQGDEGDSLHDRPRTKPRTKPVPARRARKDFTREEEKYLLSGVRRLGRSWNSILLSYPFQPGRTGAHLARKYRQIVARGTNQPHVSLPVPHIWSSRQKT